MLTPDGKIMACRCSISTVPGVGATRCTSRPIRGMTYYGLAAAPTAMRRQTAMAAPYASADMALSLRRRLGQHVLMPSMTPTYF